MIKGAKHSKETRRKMSEALKGRKVSEETRNKISKSSMGKSGNKGTYKKGHKLSKEAIQKMSIAKIGMPAWNKGLTKETDSRLDFERPTVFKNGHLVGVRFGRDKNCSGEDHFNWKGGISKEPYGSGWANTLKESIRERDNYECQRCGISQEELGGNLSVHHIDDDKKNMNPDNLVCLCRSCHTTIHRSPDINVRTLFKIAN